MSVAEMRVTKLLNSYGIILKAQAYACLHTHTHTHKYTKFRVCKIVHVEGGGGSVVGGTQITTRRLKRGVPQGSTHGALTHTTDDSSDNHRIPPRASN